MWELDIRNIPRETSQVLELDGETPEAAAEVRALLDDLEEYEVVAPQTFSARIVTQRIGESIRLAGRASVDVSCACVKCLEPRVLEIDADLEYLLVPRSAWATSYEGEEEVELGAEDLGTDTYEGEELDLRPFLREALVLELPTFPTCPEEEEEACQERYERNLGQEKAAELEEAKVDLRWSKLLELKKQGTN